MLSRPIAAIEQRDARDVNVAGLEVLAIVSDCLLEDKAGEFSVGLLDLRDLVILDVDVECDDLDAGIDRALRDRFQRFGWSMLYYDAVDPKRDRLVDHIGLALGVLWLSNTCNSTPRASACALAPAR